MTTNTVFTRVRKSRTCQKDSPVNNEKLVAVPFSNGSLHCRNRYLEVHPPPPPRLPLEFLFIYGEILFPPTRTVLRV